MGAGTDNCVFTKQERMQWVPQPSFRQLQCLRRSECSFLWTGSFVRTWSVGTMYEFFQFEDCWRLLLMPFEQDRNKHGLWNSSDCCLSKQWVCFCFSSETRENILHSISWAFIVFRVRTNVLGEVGSCLRKCQAVQFRFIGDCGRCPMFHEIGVCSFPLSPGRFFWSQDMFSAGRK